jgi:hypothetical protein
MTTPTINTTFKSTSTQRGYFIPSERRNEIVEIVHSTYFTIHTPTDNFYMTCKVNGEVTLVPHVGDEEYHKWYLNLHAGDQVEITVRNWSDTKFSKTITFSVNEDGVTAVAPKGIKHTIKGTHTSGKNINSKFKKAV